MREGIRILKANILPLGVMQAVLVFTEAPFVVTGEMRKINDRLRSERPPTDRSRQPACQLILSKKTKIHFIKGTQNIDYCRNEVENHHGAL